MGQLFALSFDTAASPAISFASPQTEMDANPLFGWGFAWYPANENTAMVVKDATSPFNNSLTRVLQDWHHFRSAHFVCHLRGASKRISLTGTQPFVRSYAGRDFMLVHDGDVSKRGIKTLQESVPVIFEPMGRTDSEYVFCYLLNVMHARGVRRLAELGYDSITELLRSVAQFGTANFILSDGHDMVLFHGANHTHGLYWTRRKPPHDDTVLTSESLQLDLSDPLDLNRTVIIAATMPLSGNGWEPLSPSEVMVVRRGEVIWRCANETLEEEKNEDIMATPLQVNNRPLIVTRPLLSRVLTVFHETIYAYKEKVENSVHTLRLQPVHDPLQEILQFSCEISPGEFDKGEKVFFEDVFGNASLYLTINEPYDELRIISKATIKVHVPPPTDFTPEIRRASIPLVWMPWQRQMMMSYLLPPELPESQLRELSDYAMGFVERNDNDLFETLNDINKTLYQDLGYVPGSTSLKSTPFEVFVNRQGVCQDFANLMICLARLLNIPARYRVGYIDTRTNYNNTIQSDASHAWVELYLPYVGWCGFDPTNGCLVSRDHIRIACGRNYRDATPTSGTIYKGGAGELLSVRVKVESV